MPELERLSPPDGVYQHEDFREALATYANKATTRYLNDTNERDPHFGNLQVSAFQRAKAIMVETIYAILPYGGRVPALDFSMMDEHEAPNAVVWISAYFRRPDTQFTLVLDVCVRAEDSATMYDFELTWANEPEPFVSVTDVPWESDDARKALIRRIRTYRELVLEKVMVV